MILFIKLILWIAIVIGTFAVRSQVAQAKSNTQAGAHAQSRPNIVMFYIDDWAWNGSPVAMNDTMENSLMPVLQMPNIQKLANDGMKFGNAYGSPQCAPARVCVQTGQSAPNSGFTVYMGSRNPYFDTNREYQNFPLVANVSDRELDEDAVTIPRALKPLGLCQRPHWQMAHERRSCKGGLCITRWCYR